MKNCGKCKKVLPLTSFTINRSKSSGLSDWCRDCNIAHSRDTCACGESKVKKATKCILCKNGPVPTPNEMTPAEIAWVAGLLEGEGCWSRRSQGRNGWDIKLSMSDEDVVYRLQGVTGVGTVNKGTSREGHKDMWDWTVSKKEHREWLTGLVYPWMGTRRKARIDEYIGAKE